jgi:hypothetical protein
MKARSISALSAILICAAGCAGSGSQVTGPIPIAPPPVADLEGANLTGSAADLVMPLRVVSQSNGRTVTLIGAYADPARTVLVFRTMPPTEVAQVQVADQQGVLNASNSAGLGSIGDQYFALDAGPRVGSEGVAHLTVTILDFRSAPPSTQRTPGNWTFPLALKVQPGTPLYLSPALISVGSWNVNVEAAEVTPSVIHFQAVIDGASVSDIGQSTITLHDARGDAVSPVSYSASVTVPKQQTNSNNYKPRGSMSCGRGQKMHPPTNCKSQAAVLSITGRLRFVLRLLLCLESMVRHRTQATSPKSRLGRSTCRECSPPRS